VLENNCRLKTKMSINFSNVFYHPEPITIHCVVALTKATEKIFRKAVSSNVYLNMFYNYVFPQLKWCYKFIFRAPPLGYNSQVMKLTTHFHLLSRLRIRGALPPPPYIFSRGAYEIKTICLLPDISLHKFLTSETNTKRCVN
jgi:hypothetical protein